MYIQHTHKCFVGIILSCHDNIDHTPYPCPCGAVGDVRHFLKDPGQEITVPVSLEPLLFLGREVCNDRELVVYMYIQLCLDLLVVAITCKLRELSVFGGWKLTRGWD